MRDLLYEGVRPGRIPVDLVTQLPFSGPALAWRPLLWLDRRRTQDTSTSSPPTTSTDSLPRSGRPPRAGLWPRRSRSSVLSACRAESSLHRSSRRADTCAHPLLPTLEREFVVPRTSMIINNSHLVIDTAMAGPDTTTIVEWKGLGHPDRSPRERPVPTAAPSRSRGLVDAAPISPLAPLGACRGARHPQK